MPEPHTEPHADPHADPSPTQDLDTGELLRIGQRALKWGGAYLRGVGDRPVQTPARPGDLLAKLPGRPPEHPPGDPDESWDAIFRDLDELVVPGLTHWQSPSFFAFFPCNQSTPTIVAELLSAILNVNGMNWATGPAITELEIRMLDWMAHAMGLPAGFRSDSAHGGGVIQSTASDATLVALLAARQRARRMHPGDDAVDSNLCAYTSTQAHSSVVKAAMVAGLARTPEDDRRVRLVPADACLAMDTGALSALVRADREAGLVPAFVSATIGTTSSGAVDPVRAIAGVLGGGGGGGEGRPWVHADAAWAGAAMVCPEHRAQLGDGLEGVDSLCVNPHKWLLTNFDCDLMWTRSKQDLVGALSITPEYLRHESQDAGAVDFRDWQVPLGRRFRALKLWFLLRRYGVSGLREHIRRHVAWTQAFEAWVGEDDRFEVPVPRSLSLVCLRLRAGDEATRALLDRVNASGRAYLSHTTLPGDDGPVLVIRVAIGGTRTERSHVEALWGLLRAGADAVLGSGP